MAIPIGFQSSEDAEESYRSLDLLLEQLLITLRQVLVHRRREAAANAQTYTVRHRHVLSEGTAVEETSEQLERPEDGMRISSEEVTSTGLPLPDVVLDTNPDCGLGQEQKESRTAGAERTETTTAPTPTPQAPPQRWVQVGADLKRIADQLLATNSLDQKEEKKSKMKDEKDPSLLSLLCPPLGGSVWTTVALLLGWGLLSRSR